nr:ABC transporter substrate-binding protein [uncultured Methanospirillum sp.]
MTMVLVNNKLVILGLILLLLFGCAIPALAEDKVLRVGTTDQIKSLSLMGDYNLGQMSEASNLALLQFDENGKVIPALASSYDVSSDNTVWTFTLKDDIFWSDGKPITGDDVLFSIQYYGTTSESVWLKDLIKDSQVNGKKVIFTLNKPYTNLAQDFARRNLLPKHIWESIDKPVEYADPKGSYVGSGPFYIENVDLNSAKVIFKKNPYWKGKQPYYDSIEVSWFKNEDAASKALESGAMDTFWKYSGSYPYSGIETLKSTGKFDVLEKPSSGLTFLGFNLNKEPMSDPEFRKAVSKAINYQEMVDILTLGHGKVPNLGFIPPAMNAYVETDQLQYSVEDAKKVLADAGYKDTNGNGIIEGKDAKDIKLDFLIRDQFNREGDLVKEYLGKVGIGAELHSVDQESWTDLKDKFNYDITLTRTTPFGMIKEAGWATAYFESRMFGGGQLHTVSDPKFLELCDKLLSTTDQTKIAEYAKEVQQYYAENLPGIALYWKNDVTPYNKAITGWYSNPMFGIMNEFTFSGAKPVA